MFSVFLKKFSIRPGQTPWEYQRAAAHLVRPSPWPFLTAISLGSLLLGTASYFHSFSYSLLNILIGLICLIISIYAWFSDKIFELINRIQNVLLGYKEIVVFLVRVSPWPVLTIIFLGFYIIWQFIKRNRFCFLLLSLISLIVLIYLYADIISVFVYIFTALKNFFFLLFETLKNFFIKSFTLVNADISIGFDGVEIPETPETPKTTVVETATYWTWKNILWWSAVTVGVTTISFFIYYYFAYPEGFSKFFLYTEDLLWLANKTPEEILNILKASSVAHDIFIKTLKQVLYLHSNGCLSFEIDENTLAILKKVAAKIPYTCSKEDFMVAIQVFLEFIWGKK